MKISKYILATLTLFLSVSANAALLSRDLDGNPGTAEAYYDDEANLTWLADANYALTSGYDGDGFMDWGTANDWAASLDLDGVAGADGWRLPTTPLLDDGCSNQADRSWGYNCSGSEMGNLFYNVLGGTQYTSIDDVHNENYYLFSNIGTDPAYSYWSATEYVLYDVNAWTFDFENGHQGYTSKPNTFYAWAVYDGDIAAPSAVPVPAAVWLFGSGLVGLIGIARRRKV